jgi:hypothetical protein
MRNFLKKSNTENSAGGWRLAAGGWRLAAGGWRLAAGGWRLAAGGLVLAALSACGGGGAGSSEANNSANTQIIKNAPLTVNAGLNTGVTVLSSSDSIAWKVITRLTSDPDSPATLLQAPLEAVVAENDVLIHNQTAYKVASVKTSSDGTKLVYVGQPNIGEVFSTFEMAGDLPMGKFEQIQAPQNQKTTSSGLVGWKQTGSFEYQKETIRVSNKVETVTEIRWPESASEIKSDDYDPSALAELGSCFKVTTDKREVEDDGKKLEVFGFKVAFTCANIKSSSGQASVGVGAAFDFGVYPKRTFKPGFNLINPSTYKTGIEQSFYTTFSGNVNATAKAELSKIFRLLSVKTNFIIAVGVVPVTVTIWTPLDLILQAELEGKAKIETSYIGKLLINEMGVNWTTLQPFTNKFDELVSAKVSASVTPYLRPGLGIAVWGMTPFSFHPKVGVKMEYESDVLLDCSKLSFTVLAGLDVVLVPNIWIQVGSLYGEAKRTKEIFAPMDFGKKEFSNNANSCNKPKAVISQFDSNLTAPYTSKILNDGEIRVDALGYFQGGLNLMATGSLWADNYKWEIVGSLGQAKVVSSSTSYYLTKADLDSVAFPVSVRLTVANGSLLQQISTTEVRLVGNKAPIVDGLAISDGDVYKLSSFADDLDGQIVQIQWSDSLAGKAVWNAKNQNVITVPVSEMKTVVSSGALPLLKLKVWDNTGETAEKYIQAQLVCSLPKVADSTGMACILSSPVVTAFTPVAAAQVGITTTFNITGTNLPATDHLDITLDGCANIQFVSQSATQHQFTCNPNVAGTLTAVIRTLPGTTPLGSFPVVVSTAPSAATFLVPGNLIPGATLQVPAYATNCTFKATGAWSAGPNAPLASQTAAGDVSGNAVSLTSRGVPVPLAPVGSLVVKRSSTGLREFVGAFNSISVTAQESLQFMMNDATDAGYTDLNTGAVSVAWSCTSGIDVPAVNFVRGLNVALIANGQGYDALANAPPYGATANAAEWDFTVPTAGNYELVAIYAAALSRPATISFNGVVAFPNALAAITGGWFPADRQAISQGFVNLPAGAVTMRVARGDVFPHIKGFILIPKTP